MYFLFLYKFYPRGKLEILKDNDLDLTLYLLMKLLDTNKEIAVFLNIYFKVLKYFYNTGFSSSYWNWVYCCYHSSCIKLCLG